MIKHYVHVIIKRIWLVAVCFVIALVVSVINLSREVPVFSASATIMLSHGLRLPQQMVQQDVAHLGDRMDTELQLMRSRQVRDMARDRMGLPAGEVERKVQNVRIGPVGRTAMVSVQVTGYDRHVIAEFANALIDAYIAFKAESRLDTSQATVISLTQQAARIQEELRRAEDRVLAFKRENSVIAIDERGNIAARTLARLSAQAAAYRTERMILEAQQPMLREASEDIVLEALSYMGTDRMLALATPQTIRIADGGDPDGSFTSERSPEALIDRGILQQPQWHDLRKQKAILEDDIQQMRTMFRDSWPPLREKLQRLRELDREVEREVQHALRRYYASLEALHLKERAVRRAEMEWEEDALAVSRKADEFQILNREVSRLRSLYDLVYNRLREVDISIGVEPETVRIVDRARPPGSPNAPRRVQGLFLAGLIGIGIGIGLILGLELIDDSIRYPEDVKRYTGLNFMGIIPSAKWDPGDLRSHILSNMDQKSGLAEAYRNVRSSYLYSTANLKHKTLALISSVPREGKTTTSLNLSVSLSQAGMRVLLVDADMRRGELHKFFGLEGGRGLSDVLGGSAKPDSVIQRTGLENLDLMATGPFPATPTELLMRAEFRSFIEYASRSYDKIIFDCPPVMAVSEAAILGAAVDGAIMVVWAGHTSRKVCQLAIQTLRQRGANLIGCILNNLEFGRVGYYYYSTYYGYYNYDNYYERSYRTSPAASKVAKDSV